MNALPHSLWLGQAELGTGTLSRFPRERQHRPSAVSQAHWQAAGLAAEAQRLKAVLHCGKTGGHRHLTRCATMATPATN